MANVLYERVGAASLLTIDRPERRNAIDGQTAEELLEQIGWTYELAYQVFGRSRPGVAFGQRALAVLGGRGLLKAIAASGADVVVAE